MVISANQSRLMTLFGALKPIIRESASCKSILRKWIGRIGGTAFARETPRSTRRRLSQKIASWAIWMEILARWSKRWCSISSKNKRGFPLRKNSKRRTSCRRSWMLTQKWTSQRQNSREKSYPKNWVLIQPRKELIQMWKGLSFWPFLQIKGT